MTEEFTEPSNKMEIENLEAEAEEADADAQPPELEVPADYSNITDDEEESINADGNTEATEDPADDNRNPSPDPDPDPLPDPMELIAQALHHKDEGNDLFKSGDLTKASRSYRKGTSILKPLHQHQQNNALDNNDMDTQVKALLVSLQTNLSMVCFKQNKYQQSKDVASKVLHVDQNNVKALYRRALASRRMKQLDAAREDLKLAIAADPDNRAVKKELLAIKKELEQEKKVKKANLAKAFSSKGSSFLYDDKEDLEKKRAVEKKERELMEEKASEKRKDEWEDECVQRMSRGEEAISFDDYEKELKTKEEGEEKARKKLKKEEEEQEKAERKIKQMADEANKVEESDDSDDELTERELQMLRGYKKTSDGRTTSYFSREQTEEEKKLLGNIAPQRLEAASAPQRLDSAVSQSSAKSASVWNNAGTWEEKDTSDWCNTSLDSYLKETVVEVDLYTGKVQEVKDLSGDASVAFVSGKKRFVFDYNASLKYVILDEGDVKVASGTLNLLDISSTAINDELEVEVLAWKEEPSDEVSAAALKCRELLVAQVRSQVLAFVQAFNAEY
jgi:tetratricopeptide (TPR) repeat protein